MYKPMTKCLKELAEKLVKNGYSGIEKDMKLMDNINNPNTLAPEKSSTSLPTDDLVLRQKERHDHNACSVPNALTILDLAKAQYDDDKERLCNSILKLLQEFEEKHGVHLTATSSDRHPGMGGVVGKLNSFRCDFGC